MRISAWSKSSLLWTLLQIVLVTLELLCRWECRDINWQFLTPDGGIGGIGIHAAQGVLLHVLIEG